MNKFILEQLRKTKLNLPQYTKDTTQLFIPKTNILLNTELLQVNKKYIIYLEDYVVNEPANFTLSSDWNNGTKPTENKVYAMVQILNGKMVRLYTVAYNSKVIWEGWVPKKAINILEEIY